MPKGSLEAELPEAVEADFTRERVMTMQSTEERLASTSNGYVYVAAGILLLLLAIGLLALRPVGLMVPLVVLAFLLMIWCLAGLYMLQPNQAALLLLFGSYRGTDRERGLRWANPFYSKSKISVRFLRYIEDERFDMLPAAVYLRGFLHEYARGVGLEPRGTAEAYLSRVPPVD